MSEIIKSSVNSKVKRLVRLRAKRTRDKEGVFLVEGRPEIDRYLESGREFQELYFCPELIEDKAILDQFNLNVQRFEVSNAVFTKLAYGHRLEGLIAVAKKPDHSLESISLSKNALCVVIEHVEKPGNLGAILRSCDGVGADAVFVCDAKVDLYNPNVIRASLGTIFSRNVLSLSNEEVHQFLKVNQISVLAASPDAADDYTKVDLTSRVCLVVGAEDKGLSDFWMDACDQKIRIPMLGKADSLNVSVSTGVILYEIIRQRQI